MTDHKAEAEKLHELAGTSAGELAGIGALTQATLYLAEQQRMTNVLLFQSVVFQADFTGFDSEKYEAMKGVLGL